MNCNYKVNIKDIQNKYKFNIFAMGGYNDSDLRKMIESVFYALPRTTGTGTSVTLNDTARSYMHNELNATDTSQYSTTGKNKLSPSVVATQSDDGVTIKSYSDGSYELTGTSTGDVSIMFDLTQSYVIEAGMYCHLFNSKAISSSAIMGYDSSNNYNNFYIPFSSTNRIEAIAEGAVGKTLAKIRFSIPTGTETNFTLKPMVCNSSTATDFEPYTNGASPNPDYPQPINVVSGDNTITVSGRNLAKLRTDLRPYGATPTDTKIVYDANANRTASLISVKPNTNYTMYIQNDVGNTVRRWFFYDREPILATSDTGDGTLSIGGAYSSGGANVIDNITTPATAQYIFIQWTNNNSTTPCGNVEFYEGTYTSETIPHEPYQSNSVLLTLGDKEICKIGNYEDKIFKAIKGNEIYDSLASEEKSTLDYGKWYLRKNIGKVVLDGTNYAFGSFYSADNNRGYINISNFKSLPYSTQLSYMDYFKFDSSVYFDSQDIVGYCNRNNTSGIMIRFGSSSEINTQTKANNWLASNNPIIYGVLATPTNEKFNDTIQEQLEDIYNNMLSYEGQTNVSQINNDLPFNINSTAIKDLNDL